MGPLKKICYIHFDTIDSTNSWAKAHAHALDPDRITCITALEQTAGRGRRARKWVSPRGENIYASIYFCPPLDFPYLSNLGQVLSLSCALVLKEKGFSPQIKWPNDVLLSGKKVAGILTESITLKDRIGVILGIGLNVNMSDAFLERIDQPATSLSQLSGHTWRLEQILDALLNQFLKDLKILQTQGFVALLPTYEQLLAFQGKSITYSDDIQTTTGICRGVCADGRLKLELPDGQMVLLSAGDVCA